MTSKNENKSDRGTGTITYSATTTMEEVQEIVARIQCANTIVFQRCTYKDCRNFRLTKLLEDNSLVFAGSAGGQPWGQPWGQADRILSIISGSRIGPLKEGVLRISPPATWIVLTCEAYDHMIEASPSWMARFFPMYNLLWSRAGVEVRPSCRISLLPLIEMLQFHCIKYQEK